MADAVSRAPFGVLASGETVEIVTLRAGGLEARVLTFGATLQALHVPDRGGTMGDIVIGHDDLAGYVEHRSFFGATIGRYANRIAKGRFDLDGHTVEIAPNDGANALHGGADGFDQRVWRIEALGNEADPFVTFARQSADGEAGFPGTLDTRVTYRLRAGELELDFEAVSDRPTVVNLTNHAYFNLGGAIEQASVLSHRLRIAAETYLPIDGGSIPEGGPAPVEGTPFDFRAPAEIGARVRDASHPQILRGRGYDHNFCLDGGKMDAPRFAARVEDEASGRAMELWTDQPGVQFYSGNFLNGTVAGKNGRAYRMGDAFCLEPQLYPDTPNRPDFPTARLDAGATYRHRSIFKFSTI
ncbi:aldose epimerase family protein [Aureimonas sp. AU20]|uniref:aldose epimerase family protein n=1 Tax=Aureimonas sp. AU20 TaxID=1349819 RepID=UPI000722786C|nr:aldose epimerase family protein [Aureimonas sp. AU20]ALN72906.1 hypothetical protein M673_09270 [Aureimonas sp. AU20]